MNLPIIKCLFPIPIWWCRLYKIYSKVEDDKCEKSTQNQSQKSIVTTILEELNKRKNSNIYNAGLKYYLKWLILILEF